MPNRVVQTYHESDEKTRQSVDPAQSVWMAHWMRTSCNSASRFHNQLALHDESREEDCDSKQGPMLVQIAEPRRFTSLAVDGGPCNISEYRDASRCQGDIAFASDVPQSAKAVEAVTEGRRVEITTETLAMNSRNLRNPGSELHPFPMFNFNQKIQSILAPKKDPAVCDRHPSRSQIDDNSEQNRITVGTNEPHFPSRVLRLAITETEFPSKEYHPHPEHLSQSSGQSVEPYRSLKKKSFPVSRFCQDNITGSTSYGFKSGGTQVRSFTCRKEETDQSGSLVASKEHFANTNFPHVEHEHSNHCSYFTFLGCDKKMGKQVISRNSGSSYSEQKDGAVLSHDPSTSNFRFPISVGEQGKRMHGTSGSGLLPSHSNPSGVSKLEELNHGCCSLHRMPMCSVHDVETLRICSAVDSVERVPGGPPKVSKTTHSFLITKKTDLNLSKADQMIRESTVSTAFKGNALHELLTLPLDFDLHGKRGIKLQPLGSSTDSEKEEDVRDVKTGSLVLKNESSAETDTMDFSFHHMRNSMLSTASSTSNKDVLAHQNPATSQETVASSKEKLGSKKLPDINQELPFSAVAGSMDNMDLSTSKTESLDVLHLLSHVEQAENSNSSPQYNSPLGPDPSSRWVKRLKLGASVSLARGTQSSKMGDPSSREKANKLFSQIVNYSRTSSEPMLGKHLGKGQMELDKTMRLLRNRDSSSMDSMKGHQDVTLSSSWIQRWCRNRPAATQNKSAAPVVCEPQSSKAALDEFQRKQFPSIAAMALMGKAMSGFQACEFRKSGSFVVWNTREV